MAAALELGVRDYLAKTGFKRVHIGLSGGIDSGLVTVIAARAIGAANVHCIGMPGPFSSEGSVSDARALCEALGVKYDVLPITDAYDSTLKIVAPQFEGTPFGLAEENSQARLRGVVLMALSNKFGSLVLACGNKSELAVGYSTLYGDMCGGLEVIGDLYKTQVYALCRYYNDITGGAIPVAMLDKPPSAELRPDQKDTDSLPPYEVLDPLLEAYIEEAMSVPQLVERFGDEGLVRRIVRMVDMAEYKRRQAPPVLRVSRRAFGPGRAMPIVQRVAHGG
jgi:NAD+ synthase (glutamine-hydrolysing)